MSLRILNAHTGEQYTADHSIQRSLETTKLWLSGIASVVTADQILLTPAGKQAKFAAISTEPEIFLYDRKLITSTSSSLLRDDFLPSAQPISLSAPPSALDLPSEQNDIEAWTRLFEARRDWAQDVVRNSRTLSGQAQKQHNCVSIIQRGLGVAVGNLQSHVRALESKYAEAKEWGKQTSQEQEEMMRSLDSALGHLPRLPASQEFKAFVPMLNSQHGTSESALRGQATLDALIHTNMVDEAVSYLQEARESMMTHLGGLESAVKMVVADRDKLVAAIDKLNARSIHDSRNNAAQLMEEIEIMANKIASDCEHVASLPAASKSVAQALKMASSHSKSYIPSLKDYFEEMTDIVQRTDEERKYAATQSLEKMQFIARIEASFSQANSQLMSLDLPAEVENALQFISLVSQLPFVYGALLIEGVRRREWSDKLRAESATLAEDIAGYREEEEKRRKRWLKNIGHLINEEAVTGGALKFDLSINADEKQWPEVNRDDISRYLHALRGLSGVEEIVEELSEAAKDLDRPTKRQIKRAKESKTGSVQHLNSGRESFLLRDNDDMKVLQALNAKLEGDLKGQKSRIRKLEELLYRQQESRRPSSANIFTPTDVARTETPTQDYGSPPHMEAALSRKGSVASRRPSSVKSADEKALARRVITLEAELAGERQELSDARHKHESEARVRAEVETRAKTDLEENRSTKKDLMENMEAQQREFADERRLLQGEVRDSKLRLEEMEEEIDRILGSRENEQQNMNGKVSDLNLALEEAKKKLADFETAAATRRENEAEQIAILQNIRADLAGEGPKPKSIEELLQSLEELAGRSMRQVNEFKHALEAARSDKDSVQVKLELQERKLESSKEQTRALEGDLSMLRNDHAAKTAKSTSLSNELDDARAQLKSLRSKFADGETGSEALRGRLEEQASRAGSLATELAQAQSHVNSLDFELSSLQRRHHKAVADASAASKRLEQRAMNDRELTNLLVNTQDELIKLLDSLGLSVIYREGIVAIQRTSKLNSTSTSGLADATMSMTSTTSVDLKPDPSLLQWMNAPSAEEETKVFTSLCDHISTLDMPTFSEAIIKLRRDVEWTGKKWKQEARNYRDKYHSAQSEGHEKIAFRSFKDGDLALFLPTRNQATRPWAAFNVGAPHYFLREQDAHKLQNREWLVARISKVEERVVDLSKTMSSVAGQRGKAQDAASIKSTASEGDLSYDDDNPFELSDGLRWYLLDAAEERPGAPSTPGLGKSTVASANVDAKGSIRMKSSTRGNDASTKLGKSLESRRSSSSSKRASISAIPEETHRELSGLGTTHLRPGSRSSATAPSADPSGLVIAMSGSASSPQQQQQGRDLHEFFPSPAPALMPTPRKPRIAMPSTPTRPTLPYISTVAPSASPSTPNWSDHGPPQRQSPSLGDDLSPSRLRPRSAPSNSHDASFARTAPQQYDLSASPAKAADLAKASSPCEASKKQFSPQGRQPRTAWESLWSLDLGFEEGKGRRNGSGKAGL